MNGSIRMEHFYKGTIFKSKLLLTTLFISFLFMSLISAQTVTNKEKLLQFAAQKKQNGKIIVPLLKIF